MAVVVVVLCFMRANCQCAFVCVYVCVCMCVCVRVCVCVCVCVRLSVVVLCFMRARIACHTYYYDVLLYSLYLYWKNGNGVYWG